MKKKKKVTLLDTGQRNTTIAIVMGPTFMDIKRSKRKQYIKQWKKDHPDKIKEYQRKHRINHREEYNRKMREYLRRKANQKGLKRKRGNNNETKSINSRGKNV